MNALRFNETCGCRDNKGAGLERNRQLQSSASLPVRNDGDDETDKIVALGGLGPLAGNAGRLGLTARGGQRACV